jgi:hypothetical protein
MNKPDCPVTTLSARRTQTSRGQEPKVVKRHFGSSCYRPCMLPWRSSQPKALYLLACQYNPFHAVLYTSDSCNRVALSPPNMLDVE